MSPITDVFPPSPKFTEKNLSDQLGKVFVITSASSGVGFELAKILYQKNGTVYIATRSVEKINNAMSSIKQDCPLSKGKLEPLVVDLSDLSSIKPAAEEFLAQEDRLDVLVHNAGVMTPPVGSKTKQGHDLEMGTNCLGPFLLNHYLEPILRKTAKVSNTPGSVRVIWVSSLLSVGTPPGGIILNSSTGQPKVLSDAMTNYMQSKVGNVFLAHECAERLSSDGIISLSLHPGLMKTELQRHSSPVFRKVMGLVFKTAKYGAYTELFGSLSPEITLKDNGGYIVPWGRHGSIPDQIANSLKAEQLGGSSISQKFCAWCSEETKSYRSL